MRLIIHADDFGISESVSRCIAECFAKGWVTETSLMVNMPYADEAVLLAKDAGFADKVGLHLNLSEGMPLTEDVKGHPRLCNSDGSFNKRFHHGLLTRFMLTSAEESAIRREVCAQLDKFCSYGGLLMKIDSHHHVHTDWVVYKVLEKEALARGFDAMRISATLHDVGMMKSIYKDYLNARIARHFRATNDFDGFNPRAVAKIKAGTSLELMTHPMYSTSGEILDTKRPFKEIMEIVCGR